MKSFQLYSFIFIVFLVFFYTTANGQGFQEPDPLEVKIIPPSPNTASLGKYGEVPVGLYTGIPQISIPLTSIQDGSLSMPISLSYHAGGVRVEEIASWVGLGWSLNAGGVITRQVRGIPDEDDMQDRTENIRLIDQWIVTQTNVQGSELDSVTRARDFAKQALEGVKDTESDLYVFNINGISGTFYFGENNKVIFQDHQDIKVEWLDDFNWIIIDAQGNKYYLGASKDKSRVAKERTFTSTGNSIGGVSNSLTAWYLLEIEDATQEHKIILNYKNTVATTYHRAGETFQSTPYGGLGTNCGQKTSNTFSTAKTFGVQLVSIETNYQKITFDDEFLREDLNSHTSGNDNPTRALSKIRVENKENGNAIKGFEFGYSYFESQLVPNYSVGLSDDQRTKRLRLDWVREKNENILLPPHRFEYNSTRLPERFSCQMDFWGFYNGKAINDANARKTLLPTSDLVMSFFVYDLVAQFEGADRTPNHYYAKAATLEKIIYPIGGHTVFEYEANSTSDNDLLPYGYQNKMITFSNSLQIIEGNVNVNEQHFVIANAPQGVVSLNSAGSFFNWTTNIDCDIQTVGCAMIQIKGISNPSFTATLTTNQGKIFLDNGEYKILGIYYSNGNSDEEEQFTVDFNWQSSQTIEPDKQIEIGGLRVKKVATYESSNVLPIIKTYKYVTEEDSTLTSGKMPSIMGYLDMLYPIVHCGTGILIKSSSHYPLVKTQGGYVCYTRVITQNGETEQEGITVNMYSFLKDNWGASYPFVTLLSNEGKRGDLLKTQVYGYKNGSLQIMSETNNEYNYLLQDITKNLRIYAVTWINGDTQGASVRYELSSYWKRLQTTTQKMYDENNSQLVKEQTTNYFYNDDARHTLPIRTETVVDNKQLITHTKYPLDYQVAPTSDNVSEGIYYLQGKNIVGAAVETYTTELDNSTNQEKTISAQIMVYNQDKPYLKEIHQLEANSAVSDDGTQNFVPSFINAQGNFVNDSRYEKRLEYYKYDDFGNPLEFGKTKDVRKSYIWGYQNTYPIAEVINASQDQIAHTSFEEDGNRSDARTGEKSLAIKQSYLVKENAPIGKYLFSVWVKNSGTITVLDQSKTFDSPTEWLRIEFVLDITEITDIVIFGHLLIDEVRLHPLESHMITRTYTPLIGVSSETNVNHNSNFYEYDALQRLHIIRDQEGNIIKRTDYEYKGN